MEPTRKGVEIRYWEEKAVRNHILAIASVNVRDNEEGAENNKLVIIVFSE